MPASLKTDVTLLAPKWVALLYALRGVEMLHKWTGPMLRGNVCDTHSTLCSIIHPIIRKGRDAMVRACRLAIGATCREDSIPAWCRFSEKCFSSLPSKHDTLSQCWFIVGPELQTMSQHWINVANQNVVYHTGISTQYNIHVFLCSLSCIQYLNCVCIAADLGTRWTWASKKQSKLNVAALYDP